MGDKFIMSKKERQRKAILEQVFCNHIDRTDAATRLRISGRQLKRIIARYRALGDAGLIHKSRGKPSGRAYSAEKRQQVISLYEDNYLDFGPTFASEKLQEEDGVDVHPETLRLWLKAAGLWQPHRKRKHHRTRRARRSKYGAMLQLDGSIHAWFKGVDEKQCLMNMVDDATGKTLSLMDIGETTRAAFSLLKWWITDAGIPMSIYIDLKSLYVSPKSLQKKSEEEEELVESEWLTHFSKACKKLGIEVIKAYSPQAKGRVERNHAVYQDRFVKELKLKNVTSIEGANKLLSGGFVNKLNEKFAKPASDPQDAHVPLRTEDDLDRILCWEYMRQVKNDWTVQFNNQHYQIEKTQSISVHPKQKILVCKHLDDSISLWHKDQRLSFHPIDERPCKERNKSDDKAGGYDVQKRSELSRQNKHKSPWNQFNPSWLKPSKSGHPATI